MTRQRLVAIAMEDDRGLDGEVAAHFGRCPFYLLVDVVDASIGASRTVANPYFEAHQPGVIPGFVAGLHADVILAGGMGPRAVALFGSYGIEIATGAVGQARAVLQAWIDGRLRGIVPCAHDHPASCGGHEESPPPTSRREGGEP
jgi:predicted Fe-Mo cluster-binding NifX family protein